MKKLCDLHIHSTYSDGTFTPKEIIEKSIDIGLSAVALCDHNTVDGIESFLSSAKNAKIEAVAGAEFSADLNGKEVHILALFIPQDKLSEISALMLDSNNRKEQSNIELVNKLCKAGFIIDYDEIKRATPTGKVNRAHIGAALTAKGYTASVNEAFATLLSKNAGYYTPPHRFTAYEILDFINSIDAISVLAHPFLNLTAQELEEFLPLAKSHGLVGMECKYCLYDESTEKKAIAMADRFGLKYSGGSDFHGSIKPDISLGNGKGNLQIPYEWYINLKNHKKISSIL